MTDSLLALGMVSESSQSQMQQNSHLLKRFAWQKRPFYQELFFPGSFGKESCFPYQAFLAHISVIFVFATFSFDASRGGHGTFLKNSLSEATACQEQTQM